jgi:tartrate-resistant acid phosphatase type 5
MGNDLMKRFKYLMPGLAVAIMILVALLFQAGCDVSQSNDKPSLYRVVAAGNVLSPTTYLPVVLSNDAPGQTAVRFAVIGDYGDAGADAACVAALVKSWHPDFIITLGDNNYPSGEAATIDDNIGQHYSEFIYPYSGVYTSSVALNRFFPSLGNHDWVTVNAQPYLDYFPISSSAANTGSSGNERYYDFIQGPVHFFALDSDPNEPDGNDAGSIQANWLQAQLAASTTPWQLVYFHHAPYSSGPHGSNETLQWPFATWGADVVMAGHDHTYERLFVDGIPYFVNGLGGRGIYNFGTPIPESQVRYNDDFGAMMVEADKTTMSFHFYSITGGGTLIDTHTVTK